MNYTDRILGYHAYPAFLKDLGLSDGQIGLLMLGGLGLALLLPVAWIVWGNLQKRREEEAWRREIQAEENAWCAHTPEERARMDPFSGLPVRRIGSPDPLPDDARQKETSGPPDG